MRYRADVTRHRARKRPARCTGDRAQVWSPAGWAAVAVAAGLALVTMTGCAGGRSQESSGVAISAAISGQSFSESGEGSSHTRLGTVGRATGRMHKSPPTVTALRSGVLNGALFGGDVPLAAKEPSLGRKLAIVRDYYQLGMQFPFQQDAQIMASGSTLLVSLDTVPGGPTYAAIAAGQQDAVIRPFLASVERAAVRYRLGAMYIAFEHEADVPPTHVGLGTPAQFVSAWDHVHQLAESMHLDWNQGGRLHWVWILTSQAFRLGIAGQYWPGANEADIVGADGYNAGQCRQARPNTNLRGSGTSVQSPAKLFGATVSFARAQGGLPIFIPEWGTIPYTSSAVQPRYIRQMQSYVIQNPEIAAALYWDNHGHDNGCDYSIDNYPASLDAMATMGQASALQGQIVSAS